MNKLKTNYKNDKYTGKRLYQVTNVSANTINLDDITQYAEEGDIFSADDFNDTNKAINDLSEALDLKTTELNKSIAIIKTELDKSIENVSKECNASIARQARYIEINLPLSGWSANAPYVQTVSVSGISSSDRPVPGLIYPDGLTEVLQAQIDKSAGMITKIETLNGSVRVTCQFKKPIATLKIGLKGV